MKYIKDKNFVLAVLICIEDLRMTIKQTAERMECSETAIRYIYHKKK